MGDGREPAAVRHAEHDGLRAVLGEQRDELLEHRHHHVEPFDREGLLRHELLAEIALHRLDLGQALEHLRLALRRELAPVQAALDVLAQPLALLRVRDVLDLVGDGRAVGLAQARQHVAQRVAGHLDAQDRGRDGVHHRRGEVVGRGVERRVAGRRRAERVERRAEVAVAAVGRHDRHPGRDRAQHLLGRQAGDLGGDGRGLVGHPGRGRGGSRAVGARGADRRVGADLREQVLVEAARARQQLVDPLEVLARLRALDDAVVVGRGQGHDLLDPELLERRARGVGEARRVGDRAGRDDRALADHQARHRGDRPDPARVGQGERRAGLLLDRELAVARLDDEVLVGRAEAREVELVGVLDHRHDQEARAVFLLRVDRQAEVDPGLDPLRLAVAAPERGRDGRDLARRAGQREGDDVGERDLLGAALRLERGVELGPARFERADVQGPERGRDRDGQRLLHVGGQGRDRALEVGHLGLGRRGRVLDRGPGPPRRASAAAEGDLARGDRALDVLAQDQAVGARAGQLGGVDVEPLDQPAGVVRENAPQAPRWPHWCRRARQAASRRRRHRRTRA